jgi:uncharacterized protein (TIGR02001 family)
MTDTRKLAALCGAAGVALVAISGTAAADGYEVAAPTAAADEGRKFTYSFNIGVVSDYIFRGYSQSSRDPVMQGGLDVGYGIAYAGIWASGIDFDFDGAAPGTGANAEVEIDYYGGIKPEWHGATFDFGVLYYSYPGADDQFGNLSYLELKAGVSGSPITNFTTGVMFYWSPDYAGETGSAWTAEGNAGYTFHKVGPFVPTINGVLGVMWSGDQAWQDLYANGAGNYVYWNAGMALAVDNMTFDFRYWDTNVNNENNFCNGPVFQCGGAFVFAVKVAVP